MPRLFRWFALIPVWAWLAFSCCSAITTLAAVSRVLHMSDALSRMPAEPEYDGVRDGFQQQLTDTRLQVVLSVALGAGFLALARLSWSHSPKLS